MSGNGFLRIEVEGHIWTSTVQVEPRDLDLHPAEFSKRFLEPAIAAIMSERKRTAVKP